MRNGRTAAVATGWPAARSAGRRDVVNHSRLDREAIEDVQEVEDDGAGRRDAPPVSVATHLADVQMHRPRRRAAAGVDVGLQKPDSWSRLLGLRIRHVAIRIHEVAQTCQLFGRHIRKLENHDSPFRHSRSGSCGKHCLPGKHSLHVLL